MSQLMGFFRHNVVAKVIALLAAIIMWFFVMNEQDPILEKTIAVPVVTKGTAENTIVTVEEKKVKLRLRAPRSAFLAVPRKDMKAVLELGGLKEGTHTVKPEELLPPGIELLSAEPEKIEVKLEKIIQRQIPVVLQTSGNLAEGCTIASLTPSLKAVSVKGPREAVEKVNKAVGIVQLSENSRGFSIEATLLPFTEKGRLVDGVTLRENFVNVEVEVANEKLKKAVPVKVNLSGEPSAGYVVGKIEVTPGTVEVSGRESVMDTLTEIETVPISVMAAEASFSKVVRIKLPGGVFVSPNEVTVEVEVVAKPQSD